MSEKPEALRLADDLRARIAYRPSRDSTQTLLTCDDAARCLEEQHAKIERLREEVRLLRLYGNKDCTAMADEAMKEAALRREET